MTSSVRLTIVVILLAALTSAAHAQRTWYVLPDGTGDAPTIQAAADSSARGDTILLGPGTFTGPGNRDIEIQHGLTITSSDGTDVTIIDFELQGSGFALGLPVGNDRVEFVISQITFRNPRDAQHPGPDPAIYFYRNSGGLVMNCVFEGGDAGVATGPGSGAEILGCRFSEISNVAIETAEHGGIVANCTFERCGTGVRSFGAIPSRLEYCEFSDCDMGVMTDGARVEMQIGYSSFRGNKTACLCCRVRHWRAAATSRATRSLRCRERRMHWCLWTRSTSWTTRAAPTLAQVGY